MLDTFTLRVVFVVLALCALTLFFRATYQPTRSRYAGWWCIALLAFSLSSGLLLFNGTSLQVVANPASNIFGVAGVLCIWASVRSLTGRTLSPWVFLGAAAVNALASAVDDPATNIWAGGEVYLTSMSLGMVGAAVGLSRIARQVREDDGRSSRDPQYRASLVSMSVTTALFSFYYLVRTIGFIIAGPDSVFFDRILGSETTTLIIIVTLVVAIFSMSALSRAQYTTELRRQATHDGLTGLLNRNEFLRQGDVIAQSGGLGPLAVAVVADIDHFKKLNDTHGHSAGDRALAAIGSICARHLLPQEVAGRLGGDEFALLLVNAERAYRLAEILNEEVAVLAGNSSVATISFGMTVIATETGIAESLERADRALYEAKAGGGRRLVTDDPDAA